MSKALTQIRATYHDDIIVREGNQYLLTNKGQELKEQLPPLLEQMNHLLYPARFNISQSKSVFSIAFTSFVTQAILPSICHHFELEAPFASLESHLWQGKDLSELANGDIDLLATIADQVPENLYGKLLAEDQYVVLLGKHHPLASQQLTIDDYVKYKHILVHGLIQNRQQMEAQLHSFGKQRQILAKTPSFLSASRILTNSNAIMTAPLHISIDYAKHFDLVLKPLPITLTPHQYYLLWHSKSHRDPEHKWFRELCFPILQNNLISAIEDGLKLMEPSHNATVTQVAN